MYKLYEYESIEILAEKMTLTKSKTKLVISELNIVRFWLKRVLILPLAQEVIRSKTDNTITYHINLYNEYAKRKH